MNVRFVVHLLSLVVTALGAGILVSAGVTALYGDPDLEALLVTGAGALALGVPAFLLTRPRGRTMIGYKEGFITVGAGWAVAALVGAIPYMVTGLFSPVDALFESMSGFTTTGASVLVDYAQPHGIMFWRSLTHWYGGMGIIVLFLAILPPLGGGAVRLFSAEAPGPVSERLTPKIRDTARGLWLVYVGISAAEVFALLLAGMPLYEAVTNTFGTMATGGFSPQAASIAAYDSPLIEAIITVFMLLAGANFALYYGFVTGQREKLLRDPELRLYLAIVAAGIAAVTASLLLAKSHFDVGRAFREAAFQVVSIQTTTGFVSADFDQWNTFAKTLLVVLMFVGGCAGSTAGGIKVVRIMVLSKNARLDLARQIHPKAVLPVKVGGRVIPEHVRTSVLGFFFIYMITFTAGTLLLATSNVSIVTAATAVAATLNNIGPGLELVGATQNYAPIHAGGKLVLVAMMVLGRLELFAIMVPFTRGFWRR
ncbi:MAG: TrkH family potassium uptake protein [Thermoleophilia bacterium]